MRFYKKRHRRSIKRYRKVNTHEYVILFDDSNSLIEYICSTSISKMVTSSLYINNGYYQLLISGCDIKYLTASKKIIFKDKLHIDEIKKKSRLICKADTIQKIKKAFKAT